MSQFTVLKENYEFRRAYAKGRSFVSPVLVTYCFKRKSGGIRVGITSGKKIGNAVERNRSRRVIRAALRQLMPQVSGNWDIVFVARTKTCCVKSQIVEQSMKNHLERGGIIKNEKTDA